MRRAARRSRPRSTTASSSLECFVGVDATAEMRAVAVARSRRRACPSAVLDTYAEARVGDTVNPQAGLRARARCSGVGHRGARRASISRSSRPRLGDPGNAGTLDAQRGGGGRGGNRPRAGIGRRVQSQDRAGLGRRVFRSPHRGGCARRGDPRRRSGAPGVRRVGATAHRRDARPRRSTCAAPTAFVLGHEAQGLDADLPLDGAVTIPMQRRGVAQRRDGRHRCCCSKRRASGGRRA